MNIFIGYFIFFLNDLLGLFLHAISFGDLLLLMGIFILGILDGAFGLFYNFARGLYYNFSILFIYYYLLIIILLLL
jgi:hypothetical protein